MAISSLPSPNLQKPTPDHTLLPLWALFVLFLLISIWPKPGIFITIGFLVGYSWGYLKVFAQVEQSFGKWTSDKLFGYFKGSH